MTRLFLGACVLAFGLALGLTGCDGVGTSPGDIESDTTGTSAFRPSPKDSTAISDSLKRVAPGGALTIPVDSVAEEPEDPQGPGPLEFDSVFVEDTALPVDESTLENQETTMVLTAPDTTGELTIRYRPAYGEFVSDEMGTLPVTVQTADETSPSATTAPATSVGETEATLNGTVDPNGAETTVQFTYYQTADSASTTQTVTADQSPLTGDDPQDVSADVTGLDSGTEYGYVVEAENDVGSDEGREVTFTTK